MIPMGRQANGKDPAVSQAPGLDDGDAPASTMHGP